MSCCQFTSVFLLIAVLKAQIGISTQFNFSVDTNKVISNLTSPFYGFTVDWWAANDPHFGSKWGNAGALALDLSNTNLIALVSAITPAILRIGGSPEDSIIYNNSNGACLDVNASLPGYSCSQTKNNYGCLNNSRWQEINTFASKTNCTLLFGLSGCYGRMNSSSAMNFSNIKGFFDTTVDKISAENLYAFEFANELDGKIDADAYGKDFVTVYDLIQEAWSTSNSTHIPFLIGTDVIPISWTTNVLEEIENVTNGKTNEYVHRLTYHSYPNCKYPNGNISVFSLSCLSEIEREAGEWSALASKYSTIAWMGEGSEHSGGGVPDVSNTYVDTFYYLYQLCEIAANGVKGTMHSDLAGGDYELIDHKTFVANPDYWILWIWKQLIGNTMYSSVLLPTESNFRGFSFNFKYDESDSSGKIVLVFINFDLQNNAVVDIQISGSTVDGYSIEQYNILPVIEGNITLQTTNITVNDVLMEYKNGMFPVLESENVTTPITVDIARLAIVVLTPEAKFNSKQLNL